MKKVFLFLICFGLVTISLFSSIKAQELEDMVEINISDPESSQINITFNLKDPSNVNYLTGFDLAFPFEINGEVVATINDSTVSASSNFVEGKSEINISAENLAVDLSADTWLKLTFSTENLARTKYGVDYLYIPALSSNFNLKNIKFKVIYPDGFEEISYVSANDLEQISSTEVNINSDNSLFVIWGEEALVNLKLDTKLTNSSAKDEGVLFNLPSGESQSVVYNDFPDFDGGVYDKYLNNYVIKNITAGGSFSILLNSDITLSKYNIENIPDLPKYNWKIKEDNLFASELIKSVEAMPDNSSKIQGINDYLVEALSPYIAEKVDLALISGIWDKLNGSGQFNSFEYCYLAISAAEHFGFKGHLAYGYLILPEFLLAEERTPHVWCEINDGDQNYFIDPFLEDQFKISYNFQRPIDRILFGRWYPTMQYNNILGLVSNSSDELNATISEVISPIKVKNTFGIESALQEETLYSGDYYYIDINLNNSSNYFLQLKDILIDERSYISTLSVQNFFPALMPEKETLFTFNNLVESNILFFGNKNITLEAKVDNQNIDPSHLKATQSVNFNINFMNIFKELVVIAVIVALIIVLYKALLEKRVRRFLNSRRAMQQGVNG